MNYLSLKGLNKEEFEQQKTDLGNSDKSTKSDKKDIEKIEDLLCLRRGVLSGIDFYMEDQTCECGHKIQFSDFIYTALVEQWHDPSFLVHTLVGSKYFVNEARVIRCSACNQTPKGRSPAVTQYEVTQYGCCLK